MQLVCQFKVLRRGCWSKKCFKTKKSHLKDADRPHVSPSNPWIQHFTNGSLNKPSTSTSLQYPVPESQLHQETDCSNTGTFKLLTVCMLACFYLCYSRYNPYRCCILTEGTDQNFVESTMCSRKKTKTSKIAPSSNDQVICKTDL